MNDQQQSNGIPVARFILQLVYAQSDVENLEFDYESGNTNIVHYRNPALCRVLDALPSVFCRTLDKVMLLVTTMFTESRTLGTGKHSAKTSLPSAKHSANSNARQRVVNRRLKLTAVIFAKNLFDLWSL
jgi:hypothetical protein